MRIAPNFTKVSFAPFLSKMAIISIWLLIALVSTTALYYQLKSGVAAPPWLNIFVVKLAVWGFWGIYALLIFRFARRFRLNRDQPILTGLLHLFFCLFSISVQVLFYALIAYGIGLGAFKEMGLLASFKALFVGLFEWYFIIYLSIVLVTYAFDYYQKFRKQELQALHLETQLVQAQLQALKMQLQPHFLFNTLNTIASLVRQERSKMAIEMLSGLSELLRITLSQKDQQQISLESELAFIRRYLELEKKRFGDKIQIEMQVAPEALDASVPNFLLQPIVENAIYHGLSKKISARKLMIKVQKTGEKLLLKVYNDGNGLAPGFDLTFSNGIGLSSTLERLGQQFEDHFQFSLNNHADGVEVMIEIPYIPYGK
ncbi:MAG: hypothetical protein DHS20C18_31300 [Saprospiraceae bacterium]|nr:MAG: hypothetical protein DHS20C18_31300 [Saprospiraceae bacterium]